MITVSGAVETKLSPEKAFVFLSEFENTSEWDPGTPVTSLRDPALNGIRDTLKALAAR